MLMVKRITTCYELLCKFSKLLHGILIVPIQWNSANKKPGNQEPTGFS